MPEDSNYRYDPWRFLKIGLVVLVTVFIGSSAIYYLFGIYYGAKWPLIDCVFMVAITISTIGYDDWLGIKGRFWVEVFTIALAFVGIGMPAFIVSSVTALIVDGTLSDSVRRRRMNKEIASLNGHTIVCGAGCVGEHCIQELIKIGRKCVVIDRNVERLKGLNAELGSFPFVVGSAEVDETLAAAGIQQAGHLIACTSDDKNNLFITLSARMLNPNIRIASEGIDDHVRKKMLTAGASAVVSPTAIGGLRLVSELIRPATTSFLDNMLRDKTNVRFGELTVAPLSTLTGKTLADAALRDVADVLVVAARAAGDESFTYNPRANFVLAAGCAIVVMGPSPDIDRLLPLFADRAK